MNTLWQLVCDRADAAPAIGAPGLPWLDSTALKRLVGQTVAVLNDCGIGRGDRVAAVQPNGPQAASAFVALAAGTTVAPLNPGYKADEFAFYLGDLRPKALVLPAEIETPARQVAASLGIPVLDLHGEPNGAAGRFHLDAGRLAASGPRPGGFAEPSDVALVLHTSGTTARPKLVPLSQANVAASARHIVASLALTPGDVCLNVMPLFHIHGLVAAVAASLAAGAAVSCTPGFNAFRFFDWIGQVGPSWYTAVPTMHQAILMRARPHREQARASGLRFIRSSSASLPPQVMAELEAMFACPVVEAYGMTEAAHQMAANPLPPRVRKPGSVGVAAGPELAILDAAGEPQLPGGIGEVAIRGANVMPGYEANPEANASAFVHGWFRTGDQGRIDTDGYLFLTGRLKEIINRGGEKVSPLEVDAVLMDHPAVAQCVTFAMPHATLGEEVAAAIVLYPDQRASEQEIRDFAAIRLAQAKVPRRVVFVDEIPKGATGKLQRIGLAERLGLTG